MLKRIVIENMFSIEKEKFEMSDSGINVLIGANASGKSNVIRIVEFISAMVGKGISSAIFDIGGIDTIVPKAIPIREVRNTKTRLEYTVDLDLPKYYPSSAPLPKVVHRIDIQWLSMRRFKIYQEELLFYEPINVGTALRKERDALTKKVRIARHIPSVITVRRTNGQGCIVDFNPKPNKKNIEAYIHWFGLTEILRALFEEPDNVTKLASFFEKLIDTAFSTCKLKVEETLVQYGSLKPLVTCSQYQIFRNTLAKTRKYDLQIQELKKEQPIKEVEWLGEEGQYLPATLRYVKKNKEFIKYNKNAFERIILTMKSISPNIEDIFIKDLKSSKEFLEFIEFKTGRPIESWNSSDGTLRALAILIAIEMHVPHQTILIEEPEQCLHPWAIGFLIDHIREVTEKKDIQVIVATHSQQVLESVFPEELFVISRTSEEGTKCNRIVDLYGKNIDKGELGRMWVKGLLGGVPYYE